MNQPQDSNRAGGILDARPELENKNNQEGEQSSPSKKKDLKDPFRQQIDEVANRAQRNKPKLEDLVGDKVLESTASSVNTAGPGKNVQADLDEMEKFNDEDIKLAEQMIFNGYAEFDATIPRFKNKKFTICSTSAEEIAIIDEMVFDFIKKSENENGTVDIPQNNVQGLRNSLFIAISYRGMDRDELMKDSSCQLNTIKKAIIRVTDLENAGDLKGSQELKKSLKKKLLLRATTVNRLATPVIDFLSDKKYEFDSKMLNIMSTPGLLPKS